MRIILLFLLIFLLGCSTPYKQIGYMGGYDDIRLQDDVYKISFKSNAYTGFEKTRDYALLRCAEVALNNDYDYFVIFDNKEEAKQHTYTTPVTSHTTGTVNAFGNSQFLQGNYQGTTYYTGGQTYNLVNPRVYYIIRCFKEKPEDAQIMVFDANQIAKAIREQYEIK